jgi:hypothetical protein
VSRYVAVREEQERKHEGAHERAGKVGTG